MTSTLGDPTCTGGGIYYNSASNQAKVCISGAWVAMGVPRVTVLPATPADGDEVYYVADATNGISWHLRYNSGSASTYKWEYVGDPPIYNRADSGQNPTITGYANLETGIDLVTTPALLIGDYMVRFGADIAQSSACQYNV